MNEMTKRTIDEYKNYLIEEEKCSVTIEKYIRDITALVNWTEGNELIAVGLFIVSYAKLQYMQSELLVA